MAYDPNNIFARILRGEIPSTKIYEDEHVIALHDLHPQRKVHALVIVKGAYTDIADFGARATEAEIVGLNRAIPRVAALLGIDQSGYRVISNMPGHGGQEIPHLHYHLLGGEPVGKLVE